MRRLVATCLLVLIPLAAVLAGCGQGKEPAQTEGRLVKRARSQRELGPVRVRVQVDPPKARLSDEPTLTLTIDSEHGVTVQKPPFGDAIGDFVIRDFREPLPKVEGNREILRQVYKLEPTRTGELAIWPIPVRFTDTRPDGDGKSHVIQTESLTVEIAPVLGEKAPSLAEVRPAVGPISLPTSRAAFLWTLFVASLLIAAAVAVWRYRRGRRRVVGERPPTPRELAMQELERILEAGWARTDVKRYYVELTGVVRRYIERTTGIRAPEQTTEEFLRETTARETFPPEETRRLKSFLESADLVKFAAHEPAPDDIQEALRRARVFIGLQREAMEAAA